MSSIFRQTFDLMNWKRKVEGVPPDSDPDKGVHRDGQWIEPQFPLAHKRLKGMQDEGKHWERTLYLDTITDKRGKAHLRLTVIKTRKKKTHDKGRIIISRTAIFGPGHEPGD